MAHLFLLLRFATACDTDSVPNAKANVTNPANGTWVVWECSEGYVNSTSDAVLCNNDDYIVPLDFECHPMTCAVSPVANATASTEAETIDYDYSIVWDCDVGFTERVSGDYRGSWTETCTNNTLGLESRCDRLQCNVSALSNATSDATGSVDFGGAVTWTCDDGFENEAGVFQGTYTSGLCGLAVTMTAPSACSQVSCGVYDVPNTNHNATGAAPLRRRGGVAMQCRL